MRLFFVILMVLFIAPQVLPDVKLVVSKRRNWMQDADRTNWTPEKITKYIHTPWQGSVEWVVADTVTTLGTKGDQAFVLVRITGVNLEQVQKYMEPLIDSSGVVLKEHKWFFGEGVIDSAKILLQQGDSLMMTAQEAKSRIKKYVVTVDSIVVVDGDDE